MAILKKAWNNFKARPDTWFFYGFFLTFTLSIRKVLFFYPIAGEFNEYSGIYLYLSDIFLIMTIIAWGYTILYYNSNSLSITDAEASTHLQNVPPRKECSTPACRLDRRNILWGRHTIFLLIPLLLVLWSFFSLFWADNKILALFKSLKLAKFYFLYLYTILNISRLSVLRLFHVEQSKDNGIFMKRAVQLIIGMGLFQALIGIWQFIIQHSVGLFWLKESLLSPDIAGVAKIVFHGDEFIRAYGLFPHPNILGGFLLASISLTITYSKLFHVEQFVVRAWKFFVPQRVILEANLIIQTTALILTFSKSAIIGLVVVTAYVLWQQRILFHVEHIWRRLIIFALILIFSFILAKPNLSAFLNQSLQERMVYQNVSRGTILNNFVLGVGSGQFVFEMDKYVPRGTILEPWQYQPVHNVFLLIWSELGFVGLFIFLFFLYKLVFYKNIVPRGTIFRGIFWGFVFIMLFDHYLWDIQQGQIMLWMILGLVAGVEYDKQHLD